MPVYRIQIERQVTNWDRLTRFVEADSEQAALLLGEKLEDAATKSCPDDYQANFGNDVHAPWSTQSVTLCGDVIQPSDADQVLTAADVAVITGEAVTYTYTVVERAGYEGECVTRAGFPTWSAANDWMIDQYGDPEDANREKMRPDIRLDGSDGSQTYEC